MSFKICPCCDKVWECQSDFVADPTLALNGYSADFNNLLDGLFYFTHQTEGCCSTMAIKAGDFRNLYSGTTYQKRMTHSGDCPGYCLDKNRLDHCDVPCECAFVREIISVIRKNQSV